MKQVYVKSAIGERIKELRKQFGLTALELAEIIGVSVEFLCLVERGSRGFSVKNLIKLSERFNVSLDYIISGKTLNHRNITFDTNILNGLSSADYEFIINLCKILTYQKCTEKELEYIESLIKCYLKFKFEKEKSGIESHQNETVIK